MRHGPGVQVWPDNAKYEGEWRENKANGRGKFWHADGDIYEGEWEDDKANGYGIYIHVNGAQYEGYWKNDLQDGQGMESWQDGSRYEGRCARCAVSLSARDWRTTEVNVKMETRLRLNHNLD